MAATARRLGRALLFPTVERLWLALFWLAGRLLRPERGLRPWQPAHGPVLVVAPHPDDEALGCGGAIALHRAAGEQVTVVIVTDGGAAGSATPATRAVEAERAAQRLGCDLQTLALPEGRWVEEAGARALAARLAALHPVLVYAPSSVDYHPEHRRVARALAAALTHHAPTPRVRVYEVGVPLTPLLASHSACLPPTAAATKAAALAAYPSQALSVAAVARLQRLNRALLAAPAPVELFWEVEAVAFQRLMAAPRVPARGLRHRPLTDPLAFLVGLRARARLRAR